MFRRSLAVVLSGEAWLAAAHAITAVAGPDLLSHPHVAEQR